MNTLLGTKQNMTSKYNELGRRMPVTRIVAEDNVVVAANEDRIHLGFGKNKNFKKPQNVFVTAVGYAPRKIHEVKITKDESAKTFAIGDKVTVSIFEPGDIVKITGTTKGRGFAGGVKRYNFRGGPKTHGQSDRHRAIGSIGQTTTPGRVFKGKRMAGHYGNASITITGLVIIDIDESTNSLLVKGPVPGAKNGLLVIQKTGKAKNYSPLFVKKAKEEIKEEVVKVSDEPKVSNEELKAATTEDSQEVQNDQTVKPKESTEIAETTTVESTSASAEPVSETKKEEPKIDEPEVKESKDADK